MNTTQEIDIIDSLNDVDSLESEIQRLNTIINDIQNRIFNVNAGINREDLNYLNTELSKYQRMYQKAITKLSELRMIDKNGITSISDYSNDSRTVNNVSNDVNSTSVYNSSSGGIAPSAGSSPSVGASPSVVPSPAVQAAPNATPITVISDSDNIDIPIDVKASVNNTLSQTKEGYTERPIDSKVETLGVPSVEENRIQQDAPNWIKPEENGKPIAGKVETLGVPSVEENRIQQDVPNWIKPEENGKPIASKVENMSTATNENVIGSNTPNINKLERDEKIFNSKIEPKTISTSNNTTSSNTTGNLAVGIKNGVNINKMTRDEKIFDEKTSTSEIIVESNSPKIDKIERDYSVFENKPDSPKIDKIERDYSVFENKHDSPKIDKLERDYSVFENKTSTNVVSDLEAGIKNATSNLTSNIQSESNNTSSLSENDISSLNRKSLGGKLSDAISNMQTNNKPNISTSNETVRNDVGNQTGPIPFVPKTSSTPQQSFVPTTPEQVKDKLVKSGIPESVIDVNRIKISENGNVQIPIQDGGKIVTITYDPKGDNTHGVTFKTGDGGIAASNYINNNSLNNKQNGYSVTYSTAGSGGEEMYGYVEKAKSALGLGNDYNIYGGSSAGARNIIEVAAKDTGNYDLVFCDAAYDAKDVVGELAKDEYAGMRQHMHDNGSFVFAYEGNGNGAGDPKTAVDNYMKLIVDENGNVKDDALNIVVGTNDVLRNHAITGSDGNAPFSPEFFLTNNEMENIRNGYDPNLLADTSVNGVETNYYYLNTNEFIRGDYTGKYIDGKYTFVDSNGNDLSRTQAEINNYVNSARSWVANTFIEQGDINKIPMFDELTGSLKSRLSTLGAGGFSRVSTVYNSVSSTSNNLIAAVNNTTCATKGISDYATCANCTAAFPESLNTSNAFLYSVTGTLLGDIKTEVSSIQQMLNNYLNTDISISQDAQLLEDGSGLLGGAVIPSNIDFDSLKSFDIDSRFTNIFSESIKEGKVGSVSVADLNSMLSPNGVIMSGLQNEIQDSKALHDSILGILDNQLVSGEGWSALKAHLGDYLGICDLRVNAAETLEAAYNQAITMIRDYIAPDASMDDGQIPEYEEKIRLLERDIQEMHTRISNLKRDIANLSNVRPTPIYEQDSKGNYYFAGYDYSAYNAAQAQIQANNAIIHDLNNQIDVAEEAKAVATEYLNRLKGFAEVMNSANQIISDATMQVNNTYGAAVNSMVPVVVQPTAF